MERSPMRDFVVGLFVLAGLLAIAYLSTRVAGGGYKGPTGLHLYASFGEIGGLKSRAPVVVAGVAVGHVGDITLDKNFRARVELDLDPSLQLPVDSSASIVTAGVLGDKYISLTIGGDDRFLKSGETIGYTESAVILERLIGQFIYGKSGDASKSPTTRP